MEHKKIPYEFIKCSLKKDDKEDFFKEAYSKALGHDENNVGKVPIIFHNGKYITESSIVARYLDQVYSDENKYGKPLLPTDPYQRAAVEIMVDWFGGSGWIKSHYNLIRTLDKESADKQVEEWKKKWKILNDRLSEFNKEGLYLPDGQVSLFEIVAFPFFERLVGIQQLCKYDVYTKWMEEFPRIKSWYNAVLQTDGVKKCLQKPEFFVSAYQGMRDAAAKKQEEQQKEKK